ncbi:FkbM family methyltransferase [Mameliella alba]|uniref:Methyltransferase n=1 Tax=Mameliella alba TaxID=561184 RepID=A0A0B3RTR1_9RHOB|nr:FkbM family methyltransferase [Mameliella alba]KHQ50163.1 Methyltransferase [Mameliella alba]
MTTGLRFLGAILPSFRGIDYRVIGRFHKTGGYSDRPIVCGNGFRMSGITSNAGYVSGINERPLLQLLSGMIGDKSIVYNIGANIGYTALWLAQNAKTKNKTISVIAFEPEPENFALHSENVALNAELDVRCEMLAIGDADGVIRMVSNGGGDGAAHVSDDGDLQVDSLTLDSFIARQGPAPDWIFMDVEGFAGECLKGAQTLLASKRPRIALEVHSAQEDECVRSCLKSHNYGKFATQENIWGRFEFWKPN